MGYNACPCYRIQDHLIVSVHYDMNGTRQLAKNVGFGPIHDLDPVFCFMKWNQSGPKMNLYHVYDCCTGRNKLDALPFFYNHLEVKKVSFRGASYQLSSSNSQNIWTHKVVFTTNWKLATNTSCGMNMTGPTNFSENRLIFPLCWLSVNAQVVIVLVKAVGCNVSDHRSPLSATTHDLPLAQNTRYYPMDVSKQF